MAQSYQFGAPEGQQESKPGAARWEAQPTPSSGSTNEMPVAPGVVVRNGNAERFAVEFSGGEIKRAGHPGGGSYVAGQTDSTDPFDNALDGTWKSPIARHAIKGDSLITIDGI